MLHLPAATALALGGGGESPDLRPGLEETDISPGPEGFFFTALVAVLLILVVRDLAKRMRRMKYRSTVEAEQEGTEVEFPGEVNPAEIVPSRIGAGQRRAREAAAADRFGDPQETGRDVSGDPRGADDQPTESRDAED